MSGAELTTVPLSTPGRLADWCAPSYERLRAAARAAGVPTPGTTQANHAWRSYASQVALWNAYMTTSWAASNKVSAHARTWNGRTYYRRPGKPSVAIPGRSNHGDGDTVDWQGLGAYGSSTWNRFAALAAEHGWNNAEGRSVNEPWHWTYVQRNDRHVNDRPATPAAPPPATEDTPMFIAFHPNGSGVMMLTNGTWGWVTSGAVYARMKAAGIPDVGVLDQGTFDAIFTPGTRRTPK